MASWTGSPREGIRDNGEIKILCLAPDVCLTPPSPSDPPQPPFAPVPYMVHANAGDDANYANTVSFTKQKAMVLRSHVTKTIGDEQGTALGPKSGTVEGICEPLGHSANVNIEKSPVIRHEDKFWMNNKNTIGEVQYVKDTSTHGGDESGAASGDGDSGSTEAAETADGSQDAETGEGGGGATPADAPPAPDDRGFFERMVDGARGSSETIQTGESWADKLQGYWNDPSSIVDDAVDVYEDLPSPGEALDMALETGGNIVEGAKKVGGQIIDDPLGSAKQVGSYIEDTVTEAGEKIGDAYDKGGLAEAIGAVGGVAIDTVNPGKKVGAVFRGADKLDDLGGAKTPDLNPNSKNSGGSSGSGPGKADGADSSSSKDTDESNRGGANGDGDNGSSSDNVRVSARAALNVDCFNPPKDKNGNQKVSNEEFDRQLQEQQDAINSMTADEMAAAHDAVDDLGTKALRDPSVQKAARDAYIEELMEDQGLSRDAAKQAASKLDATHALDIVAGGNSKEISGMADRSANRSIGSQWSKKGRAKSLGKEAREMKKAGLGSQKMNVKLKRC